MTSSGSGVAEQTSTKPYLLRALYEWCVDNGFTPYLSVIVDAQTHVPMEYVRDGEIVLNIGPLATSRLHMGNEIIECTARFSGSARELYIPVNAVAAIYARENGQGMSFEVVPTSADAPAPAPTPAPLAAAPVAPAPSSDDRPEPPPRPGGKPALRRVK
jgi:stringent starvation protein B